jgi:uncharacterized protein YcfL
MALKITMDFMVALHGKGNKMKKLTLLFLMSLCLTANAANYENVTQCINGSGQKIIIERENELTSVFDEDGSSYFTDSKSFFKDNVVISESYINKRGVSIYFGIYFYEKNGFIFAYGAFKNSVTRKTLSSSTFVCKEGD